MSQALKFLATGLAGMLDISPPAFRGGQHLTPAMYHMRVVMHMRQTFDRCVNDAKIHTGKELAK